MSKEYKEFFPKVTEAIKRKASLERYGYLPELKFQKIRS
jgi:hypothetical protein